MPSERDAEAPRDDAAASRERGTTGTELVLSSADMADFVAAVLERGVPFRFAARGSSMCPFIRSGDVLTLSPLTGRAPRLGEVVAGRGGGDRLLVHRVVTAGAATCELRGDNCSESDGRVPLGAVLGVVTRVERDGRAKRLGTGPEGALLAALSKAGALRPLVALARLPRDAARRMLRRRA